LKHGVSKEAIRHAVAQGLQKAFGMDAGGANEADRSMATALTVLKEMKATGKTWQEMGERIERDKAGQRPTESARPISMSIMGAGVLMRAHF
jgi:hypothetical protein